MICARSLLVTFAVVAYSKADDVVQPCPRVCPRLFVPAPVCGQGPGGETRTFPSKCDLTDFIECGNNPDWCQISDGACPEDEPTSTTQGPLCTGLCPFIYSPVCAANPCGTNQQTFGNECVFERTKRCNKSYAGWEIISYGVCPTEEPTTTTEGPLCPGICPLIYSPVCAASPCGTNQQTFGNECAFESTVRCNSSYAGWQIISSGACPEEPTTTQNPICSRFCPLYITKICVRSPSGELEQTFSNQCFFDKVANCGDGKYAGYTFVKDGSCYPEITTTSSPPVTPPCVVNCPLLTQIYNPVCGQGPCGQQQTFENSCFFDSAVQCNPQYKGWQIVHEGECYNTTTNEGNTCNKACTREYQPVCAIGPNGQTKTFGNRCLFDNAILCDPAYAGWGQLCEGECDTCAFAVSNGGGDDCVNCSQLCPDYFQAVCGQGPDGQQETFQNMCFLKRAIACYDKYRDWKFVKEGLCPGDVPSS